MTVAAIVCLFVHDVINIAVVTTFGVVHRFDDGFTYSQAFWMTVCSTIASVTTTITLLLDYFLTPNFANSGSGLTRKQRSAVIVFMVLLADLAIGALIYCFLLNLECAGALPEVLKLIHSPGTLIPSISVSYQASPLDLAISCQLPPVPKCFQSSTIPSVSCLTDIHLVNTIESRQVS